MFKKIFNSNTFLEFILFPLVAGSIVISVYGIFSSQSDIRKSVNKDDQIRSMQIVIDSLKLKISNLSSDVESKSKDSLYSLNNDTNAVQQEINKLKLQTDNLFHQFNSLNDFLNYSPEKALIVPLFKKDLEIFKSQYDKDYKNISERMDSVSTLNNIVLGLLFSSLVSMLGLIIYNLRNSKKEKEAQ